MKYSRKHLFIHTKYNKSQKLLPVLETMPEKCVRFFSPFENVNHSDGSLGVIIIVIIIKGLS